MITSFFSPKRRRTPATDASLPAASSCSSSSAAVSDEQGIRAGSKTTNDPSTNSAPSLSLSSATAAVHDTFCDGRGGGKRSRPNDDDETDDLDSSLKSSKAKGEKLCVPKSASTAAVVAVVAACPEAQELLSYLSVGNSSSGGSGGGTNWSEALRRHLSSPAFASLAKFVSLERASGKTVYPPPSDTFSALNLTPLSSVKVVIVGQDPYHGPGQGHGLAFSVRHGIAIPPSLRNIYKELINDTNVPNFTTMPTHGCLERWARQGVLMLNSVLTVRRGEANSHANRGWEAFTDEVIRAVNRERGGGGNNGVVFLLWGKPASKKAEAVVKGKLKRKEKEKGSEHGHAVICTSHPSPLGASKTNSPFLGSRCFSRANEALRERGMEPVDWNVDGPLEDAKHF